eukprot:10368090-Karenia_brevis.AAC.1
MGRHGCFRSNLGMMGYVTGTFGMLNKFLLKVNGMIFLSKVHVPQNGVHNLSLKALGLFLCIIPIGDTLASSRHQTM